MLAFSFGPFIGFWSAHDALVARGALVDSRRRHELAGPARADRAHRRHRAVLHAELRAAPGRSGGRAQDRPARVRRCDKIIVAGEPGGSHARACAQRIEAAWQAASDRPRRRQRSRPVGLRRRRAAAACTSSRAEFIAEFLSVETGEPAAAGELSHLVLTSLGRRGMPVIRYRTGDLVRPTWPTSGANRFVLLEGGVLGRADDMLIIRGVNMFPARVEQILRSFPEVVEYRITARKRGEMDELVVEVEDHLEQPRRSPRSCNCGWACKVDVRWRRRCRCRGSKAKARRFIDERTTSGETP